MTKNTSTATKNTPSQEPCWRKIFSCGGKDEKSETPSTEEEVKTRSKSTSQKFENAGKDEEKRKAIKKGWDERLKEKEDAKANGISVDDSSYRYDIWARWKPEVDENFKGWIEKIKEDGTYDVKWPDGLSRNCKIDDLALKRITLRVKKAKKGKKKPDQNAYLNTNTEDESTSEKQKKKQKKKKFQNRRQKRRR